MEAKEGPDGVSQGLLCLWVEFPQTTVINGGVVTFTLTEKPRRNNT
jgi:hypothetical protein